MSGAHVPATPTTVDHAACRPQWICRACGVAWPCAIARAQLLAEYGPDLVTLLVYLSANWIEAVPDLPGVAPGELYRRFVGWVARPAAGSALDELGVRQAWPGVESGWRPSQRRGV